MPELAREGAAQDPRLEELRKAAQWYQIAIGQTERLLDKYDLMPSSGADLALIKALRFQKQMMDEYAGVFTRLMSGGEPVEEGVTAKPSRPRERIKVKPLTKAAGSSITGPGEP